MWIDIINAHVSLNDTAISLLYGIYTHKTGLLEIFFNFQRTTGSQVKVVMN